MHIFLTGRVQVGKSTVIRRLLAETDGKIGGFKTKWVPIENGKLLVMMPYTQDENTYVEENVASRQIGTERTIYPEVFDTMGRRILEDSTSCDIIVMDELGAMETRSLSFQKAVTDVLDGKTPVIGVIQPKETPFLNALRARKDVHIITVNVENREEVYASLSRDGVINKTAK